MPMHRIVYFFTGVPSGCSGLYYWCMYAKSLSHYYEDSLLIYIIGQKEIKSLRNRSIRSRSWTPLCS